MPLHVPMATVLPFPELMWVLPFRLAMKWQQYFEALTSISTVLLCPWDCSLVTLNSLYRWCIHLFRDLKYLIHCEFVFALPKLPYWKHAMQKTMMHIFVILTRNSSRSLKSVLPPPNAPKVCLCNHSIHNCHDQVGRSRTHVLDSRLKGFDCEF